MEFITRLSQVRRQYPHPVVAIGIFDGVHRGHQKVLRQVIRKARACRGTAVVMTFYPHPLHVLQPALNVPLITTLSLREKLLADIGLDVCWLIRFTRGFSRIPPCQFIEKYIIEKMAPHTVIVGDDFRFGKDRLGTLALFREEGKKYGFHVQTVPISKGTKKLISSTSIRQYVKDGDFTRASRLLGRSFAIQGRVVPGDRLGREWGFPTANVFSERQLIPPCGVYIVYVQYAGCLFPGMAYIGRKPSIRPGAQLNIEVNIFDFKRNIYGEDIIIFFKKKIREEIKFDSSQALIRQIQCDEIKARCWFQNNHPAPRLI